MSSLIGPAVDRVDGRLKVTGAAKYSAEYALPGMAYGVLVLSTIPSGRILGIDTSAARAADGVIGVLTHENAPRVDPRGKGGGDRTLPVLQDDLVRYDRQPVALVVADTFERATDAASLVRVRYARGPATTRLADAQLYTVPNDMGRVLDLRAGDPEGALARAHVAVDHTYTTPIEHHNPMEPHATIARWDGDKLTVYESSQGVFTGRAKLAAVFGLPPSDVRVIARFVGGGFGSKGSIWPHAVIAAMAAKQFGRPVKVVLSRPQMFGSVGYRSQTIQRVALGANADGTLTSLIHQTTSQTSTFDQFVEPSGLLSAVLYPPPNLLMTHRLGRLNAATPTFTRAPGESSGSFALESAMDELAYAARIDPVELRLRNDATHDAEGRPFSSRSLRACLHAAGDAFGWERRNPQPRSMRAGRMLLGMGVAVGSYPANRSPASARVRIDADGSALAQSGGADIGTGAYTVFTQLAAEELGVPLERTRFELGDTRLPNAPNAGGSRLTASVGSAVKLAARDLRAKVLTLVANDVASPLRGASLDALDARGGRLFFKGDPDRGESYVAILRRHRLGAVEGTSDAAADDAAKRWAMHSFAAHFAEVQVDPDLGTVRVTRFASAIAGGRILNQKTGTSQIYGGVVMGIGMALLEHTRVDERNGRIMSANLAEYLVPVHADIPEITAIFVPEEDPYVNAVGVKGIGEIVIVGVAAAVANAVYHATGTRVRDLPITPERLLASAS
ncbi:MAG TPA: xanthine dehydrogenase family protein molybdopterin-binding subunit [Candidatus Limnocylindria bacterium]|nr:xanthine dehydrogenase family protein molybdopterin-binding subunit [Candidatus Limnocylindria bacterium]